MNKKEVSEFVKSNKDWLKETRDDDSKPWILQIAAQAVLEVEEESEVEK